MKRKTFERLILERIFSDLSPKGYLILRGEVNISRWYMIKIVKGDILEAKTKAIVIPVNCVGVMGKGLARQFKDKHPDVYQIYRRRCKDGVLTPGNLVAISAGRFRYAVQDDGFLAIMLATKGHWRQPSKMEWIIEGCKNLSEYIAKTKLESISIPKIGCGHGGLRWKQVKPFIFATIGLSPCEVHIYG